MGKSVEIKCIDNKGAFKYIPEHLANNEKFLIQNGLRRVDAQKFRAPEPKVEPEVKEGQETTSVGVDYNEMTVKELRGHIATIEDVDELILIESSVTKVTAKKAIEERIKELA